MSLKKLPVLCALLCVCALMIVPCRGEEALSLAQVYAWEDHMDLFLEGNVDTASLSCRISNLDAEIAGAGSLGDMGVTVRTKILIDQSASIPQSMRGAVVSAVQALVEHIGSTEAYEIASFGENLHVLHEFTSDRYDLSNAVKEIAFIGQQSKIYDMLYQTMPEVGPVEGKPCYYRTIIITDGVDAAESGVTAEELYLKLRENTYPIDVIAVSEAQQQTENKELAALTRISGGTYCNLHAGTDVSTLPAALSAENLTWVQVRIPESMLDGTTRQVDLTAGGANVQFDCKIPAFGTPQPPEETAQETAPAPAPEPAPAPAVPEDHGGESVPVAAVAAGGGAAAVLVAAGVLLARRKKSGGDSGEEKIPPAEGGREEEKSPPPKDDADPGRTVVIPEGCLTLCLKEKGGDRVWTLPLDKEIMIGRSSYCRLVLGDESVSREQCRLYAAGTDVMAENVSGSNVTKLNGSVMTAAAALRVGDQLKCGRVILVVDSIQTQEEQAELNKKTGFINV